MSWRFLQQMHSHDPSQEVWQLIGWVFIYAINLNQAQTFVISFLLDPIQFRRLKPESVQQPTRSFSRNSDQ